MEYVPAQADCRGRYECGNNPFHVHAVFPESSHALTVLTTVDKTMFAVCIVTLEGEDLRRKKIPILLCLVALKLSYDASSVLQIL